MAYIALTNFKTYDTEQEKKKEKKIFLEKTESIQNVMVESLGFLISII